jgi:hypothetical protein
LTKRKSEAAVIVSAASHSAARPTPRRRVWAGPLLMARECSSRPSLDQAQAMLE